MFRNMAEDCVFLLIKQKILDIDQRDVYIYGTEIIFLNGSLLIVFMLMSLLFNAWEHFLAYLIIFIPLRIFMGGYHAKKSEHCFLLSIMMYGISLIFARFIQYLDMEYILKIAGIISGIIILVTTPLINDNNPLSVSQKNRNRIIVNAFLVCDLILFILLDSNYAEFTISELIFVCLNVLLLTAGKLETISTKQNLGGNYYENK